MNNRKAKLEKALAPSLPNDTIRFADMAWGIQSHADRLAPLHAALLEAVEALEYLEDDSQFGEYVEEALAKLDKALKEMGVG